MKAYGNPAMKYKVDDYRHSGLPGTAKAFTKGFKEEVRNANRSLKKNERQQVKKELRQYLN